MDDFEVVPGGVDLLGDVLFGADADGQPWRDVWADYNLAQGRLWALVLLTTLFAPLLAAMIRGLLDGANAG